MDVEKAAALLNKSVRQVYRLLSKVRNQGVSSIVHGNTGRPPSNKIDDETWSRVLHLARTQYRNENDYQLRKLLEEEHNLKVSRESLRKKLRAAGITPRAKNSARDGSQTDLKAGGVREENDASLVEN